MNLFFHPAFFRETSKNLARFFSFILISLMISQTGFAHSFDNERILIFDSTRSQYELLIRYREAPGKRLRYLMGIFDHNHDNILSKNEALQISGSLTKIALSNLNISEKLPRAQTRIRYESEEGLSIALLYRFPKDVKKLTISVFKVPVKGKQFENIVSFIGGATALRDGIAPILNTIKLKQGSVGIIRK